MKTADSVLLYLFMRIWAATHDFQQCGILTSVDSDEPLKPPMKLRALDTPNGVQSVAKLS